LRMVLTEAVAGSHPQGAATFLSPANNAAQQPNLDSAARSISTSSLSQTVKMASLKRLTRNDPEKSAECLRKPGHRPVPPEDPSLPTIFGFSPESCLLLSGRASRLTSDGKGRHSGPYPCKCLIPMAAKINPPMSMTADQLKGRVAESGSLCCTVRATGGV
jgi:hypothetical protein